MPHVQQRNRIHEDPLREYMTHPILPTQACMPRPQYSLDSFKIITEQHLRELPIRRHRAGFWLELETYTDFFLLQP